MKYWFWSLNKIIFSIVLFLQFISIVIILKLSYTIGQRFSTENDLIYFAKHLFICIIGWILLYYTSRQNSNRLIVMFEYMFYIVLFVTFGTAIFGTKINGVRRWISLKVFSLQSSEFLKLFLPFILSKYLSENKHKLVVFHVGISCAACLLQPDLGMTILISITAASQILFHNQKIKQYILFAISILSVGILTLIVSAKYAHNRFRIFFGKETGFQINQSLKALSSSYFIGENINVYIPDSHCDFIFSAICNGLGSIFGYIIILCPIILSVIMIQFLFFITYNTETNKYYNKINFEPLYDYRITLIVISLLFQFSFQSYFHILSNLALVPTKGVTLPLVSYGGSSILANMILFGYLLSLTKRELHIKQL